MGCFNVACSVSNLTIPHGDKVMFIPLLPHNQDYRDQIHKVGIHSMLTYADCYYTPFCLPIEGTYDDYGGLEKIKKNANTEAIEKHLGMTIEDFLSMTSRGREEERTHPILKNMSGMFVLKDIYYSLAKDNFARANDRYNNGMLSTHYLTGSILEELGFDLVSKNAKSPKFPDRKANIYKKRGCSAEIAVEGYGSTIISGKNKIDVYRVNELGPAWKKVAGEILDLSKYDKLYKVDSQYEKYKDEIIASSKAQKAAKTEMDPILKALLTSLSFGSSLGMDSTMGGFFKGWTHFKELYDAPIMKGKLKEEFRWYTLFAESMYSCNRFFFPAMNGEQHGNDEESKVLLQASLKIVSDRLKDRDEDI